MVSNIKKIEFSVRTVLKNIFFVYKNKRSKYEVKNVAIWQQFLISGKHRAYPILMFVFCASQIKNYIITGLVSNFFNAPCKRMTFSLQKRKHHYSIRFLISNILNYLPFCQKRTQIKLFLRHLYGTTQAENFPIPLTANKNSDFDLNYWNSIEISESGEQSQKHHQKYSKRVTKYLKLQP